MKTKAMLVVLLVASVLCVGIVATAAPPTVASHATPALVSEINVAFTNIDAAYITRGNLPAVVVTNLTGATLQAYDADLADLADGSLTASKVASGYAAAGLTGNAPLAAMTNALDTAGGVLITNTAVAADGKTNTYIFGPVGGVYVIRSIATTP